LSNIDRGFSVEVMSLNDITLVTSGEFDPRISGYEAPEGSMFAYKSGTDSTLLIKKGPLDTDWDDYSIVGLPTGGLPGEYLVKASTQDYDLRWTDRAHASVLKAYIKNNTASTIPKGTPVYQMGTAGDGVALLAAPADAADPAKMPAIGVTGASLAPGEEGELLILGEIMGVNTSTFSAGDLVYVAPGGGYTNVKPTSSTTQVQFLGIVTKVHPMNGGGVITGTGTIDVFRNNANGTFSGWTGMVWEPIASHLDGLTDVSVNAPAIGQVLAYNGTVWVNEAPASGSATSHTTLSHRDAVDQHPISAITGLQTELDAKANVVHTHEISAITGLQAALDTKLNTSTTYQLNDLTDVTINAPTSGQSLFYNGSQWINYGIPSGGDGGGAAKRIWSNTIPSSLGTTQITPATTPPLVTAGTQLWSTTLTPLSTNSKFVVQTSIAAAASQNGANLTLVLFKNGVYTGGTVQIANSGNNSATLTITITDSATSLDPITYQVRIGTTTGTWYVNRRAAEDTFGGLNNGWVIWEY